VIRVVAKEPEPSSKDQSYSFGGSHFMHWWEKSCLDDVQWEVKCPSCYEPKASNKEFPDAGEGHMLIQWNRIQMVSSQQWVSNAATWSQFEDPFIQGSHEILRRSPLAVPEERKNYKENFILKNQ